MPREHGSHGSTKLEDVIDEHGVVVFESSTGSTDTRAQKSHVKLFVRQVEGGETGPNVDAGVGAGAGVGEL